MCSKVSQLAIMPQLDSAAVPKFNPSNFERHYQTQHVRKRKALSDLTNGCVELQPTLDKSDSQTPLDPKMTKPGASSQTPIEPSRVIGNSTQNTNFDDFNLITSTPNKVNDSLSNDELEKQMDYQHSTIRQLEMENIILRHKVMDVRESIRVFCRIKPAVGLDCFKFEQSKDGTLLKLCEY